MGFQEGADPCTVDRKACFPVRLAKVLWVHSDARMLLLILEAVEVVVTLTTGKIISNRCAVCTLDEGVQLMEVGVRAG